MAPPQDYARADSIPNLSDSITLLADQTPTLRTAILQLTYRARGTVHLPSPPANVWRGQLGKFLRRIEPEDDHEKDLSVYQQLFRTPRSSVDLPAVDNRLLGALGLVGEHVPHPFVLRLEDREEPTAAGTWTEGDETTIHVLLLEKAIGHVPALAGAFESIGAEGLGRKTRQPGGNRRRGRVQLMSAELDVGGVKLQLYDGTSWALPPDCSVNLYDEASGLAPVKPSSSSAAGTDQIAVHCVTPLRLKHQGSILRPEAMTPDALASNLFRRVQGLALCYGPGAPGEETIRARQDAFHDLAAATQFETADLQWASDSRFSHSQKQRHPVGGLVGTLRLSASPEAVAAWRNWLQVAERVHLGKKTSMGLGRIRLRTEG